ncbi:DUF4041 domain-containing protein [Streptococcus lutetiensis]|uniref:DUF4041 domain-containing protein n=1 Tax=Streptococcus lutetiensis TaxID=150055 RepID=UPI001BDB48D0|nr:DUF4041 domain-containing protein [Streptococcus lutetiensis]MBT0891668.1 DUF4041 domain-containing protein [Streptococcus lutetiensis]MBT0901289.1 DUF4041 domain-containing protein [Streptococcus lutetiensis]
MQKDSLPLYYKNWFLITLFLIGPATFYITSIAAIVLMLSKDEALLTVTKEEHAKYQEILAQQHEADSIVINAKSDAKQIISDAEKDAENIITEANNKKEKINDEVLTLEKEKERFDLILSEHADEVLFKETTVDFADNISANEIKNELSLEKLKEKELIKNDEAVLKFDQSSTKSILNKQAKQLLRAFNSEADYYISNITMRNVDNYRNKLAKSFETLNSLFAIDGVQLNQKLLTYKLKQLDIVYKFQKQLDIERELLKAQKEEIREQQKVEKELQNAKRKLEKEEKQFNNELSKLMKYLNSAQNEVEKNIYADKIKELEEKIKVLEKDKQNVLERETNTRAGYVYIISNIGSFGKDVYKIGMTRRLEPMDRISELSSASVPFPFDVHALIFSEDAPALENTLHKYFKKQEVNKVNQRKEFFKVNLEEIKELVHNEYNNTVHFTDLAAAEQYFESLKIEQQKTAG